LLSIDFSSERWDAVRKTFRHFWAGTLDRPVAMALCKGRDPGRPEPPAPYPGQHNCHDFSWTPEQVIDRVDWELSKLVFLGDAYPNFYTGYFGPGCIAAFLGAKIDNSTGKVWFFPEKELPITELHFEYDPDNAWLRRVKDVVAAAARRWQDEVVVLMPDMGAPFDVLSMFRPGEQLLYDLYDHPADVKRVSMELHVLFHRFYDELAEAMQADKYGYSDWSRIYSETPCHMLSCDFSYLIGTEMFDAFERPILADSCRRLPHNFYHLDGTGQLPHLDSILAIKELHGIQWVPGAGQPDCDQWPEVYRRIQKAGKRIQVMSGLDVYEKVLKQLGGVGTGIINQSDFARDYTLEDEPCVRRQLERIGVC
jgi:5-methyltetrahydrofolate--homocysteine methyltransferase